MPCCGCRSPISSPSSPGGARVYAYAGTLGGKAAPWDKTDHDVHPLRLGLCRLAAAMTPTAGAHLRARAAADDRAGAGRLGGWSRCSVGEPRFLQPKEHLPQLPPSRLLSPPARLRPPPMPADTEPVGSCFCAELVPIPSRMLDLRTRACHPPGYRKGSAALPLPGRRRTLFQGSIALRRASGAAPRRHPYHPCPCPPRRRRAMTGGRSMRGVSGGRRSDAAPISQGADAGLWCEPDRRSAAIPARPRLAPRAARLRPRLSGAGAARGRNELALGASFRPLQGLPVRVLGEVRLTAAPSATKWPLGVRGDRDRADHACRLIPGSKPMARPCWVGGTDTTPLR